MQTKFHDEFSKEVFEQTYGQRGEDINEMFDRVAKDLASVELTKELREEYELKFREMLNNFKFVPGGRILSNAGLNLKGTTYINCFVSGPQTPNVDSMEGIMNELKRQAVILKSEGGYGFCANFMRPKGSYIHGIANESPGSVKMLDMWDTQSEVITAGSGKISNKKNAKQKIRKGAQMVTMSIWHPDIIEFITAKQTPGRLTKFNMSILITDEFMEAVENNYPWKLEYPNYEEYPKEYNEYWNGNLDDWKKRGYTTITYRQFDNANELWDIIMESTYNRNEPGVLFVDTINRMNNLWYCEHINATNPCGEQILPIGGVCLLGSLNLTQFVNEEYNDFDYEKLGEIIPIAVRFMDNVNDRTYVPLDEQRKNLKEKRRIGLGMMGYGSALMMLKIRYGSEKALNLTNKLMRFISNKAYESSSYLAKEKGSFELYNREKYLNGNFVKGLNKETLDLINKYGIRNSHLLSIQPTGNTAVTANNVSGGLEPLFMLEYTRTSMFPYPPKELDLPKRVNWNELKFETNYLEKNFSFDKKGGENTEWEWIKEGDENLLRTYYKVNGYTWKYDKNRGLLRETEVKDYSLRNLQERGEWEANAEWNATAMSLTDLDHTKTMEVISKYICSSCSKTINVPYEYPYEDFKQIYKNAYKSGTIKGVTTYRTGTMTFVLSETKKKESKFPKQRPEVLECDINSIKTNNDHWVVLVGLFNDKPYEVFAVKQNKIYITNKLKKGNLVKKKINNKSVYNLETDYFVIDNLRSHFESDEQVALTRVISIALRNETSIDDIYQQLVICDGTVGSFAKSIARTLSKYVSDIKEKKCPECNDMNGLQFQEGCIKCKNCTFSKCL